MINLMEDLFSSWIKSGDRSSALLQPDTLSPSMFLLCHPWLSFSGPTLGSKMAAHLLSSCLHSGKKKGGRHKKEGVASLFRKEKFSKTSKQALAHMSLTKMVFGELLKRKKHGKWILSIQLCSSLLPLDPLFNLLHPFCPGS